MRILRRHTHEHKNAHGRTRFAIDVYIYEEPYIWEEGLFHWDHKGHVDLKQLKDNELGICFSKVLVHLPFDLRYGCKLIKEKIQEIEHSTAQNHHLDLSVSLDELCQLIDAVPFIDKIVAPTFAINDNGDYDESFMLEYLNQDPDFRPRDIPCAISSYSELLLDQLKAQEHILCPMRNEWVFNCFQFIFHFSPNEFEIKQIDQHVVFQLVPESITDFVLDISREPGHFLYIEDRAELDKDVIIAYMNQENEAVCYFLINEAA
jgi:hypothetical protein